MSAAARAASFRVWETYDKNLGGAGGPRAAAFRAERIAQGLLSLPADAVEVVDRAERIDFSSELTSPGYITHTWSPVVENDVRASSHFRAISGPLAELLAACVQQLRGPVADLLGSSWRVLNTRAWTTPPSLAVRTGMYKLHGDAFPNAVFKTMIYFTPMDDEHGGLEVVRNGQCAALRGPAGSWVLFYNSSVMHRGLPGAGARRACAEITLCRAASFDLELHQPGINAHWPELP